MKTETKFQTLIFYMYRTIEDPEVLMERERAVWQVLGLRGRMIIAEEGINGTLEGSMEDTEKYAKHILNDRRFKYMRIKKSPSGGKSFPRISIKVRDEIVGTQFPETINPRRKTAPHLTAKQVNSMFEKGEDFVVVDMRNSYEIESGKFINTIDPGMKASRELTDKIDYIKEQTKGKKILTVCTAGVRCEKMSALLLDRGLDNVYQLEDGIHGYIQKFPGKHFEGTLFTFDDRLTMDFTDERDVVGKCKLCARKSENYINCSNDTCHLLCIICSDCGGDEPIVFCSKKCRESAKRVIPTMTRAKI